MPSGNDLIDAAGDELDRSDLKTGGANVAVSQRALNNSLRDLFNRYVFSWRVVDPPLTVDLTAGTTLYDLSTISGGKKVQDLYVVYLDTQDLQSRPLEEWPLWRFRREFANLKYLPKTKPTTFTRVDQYKIEIALPPESSTYDLKVYYSEEFADITNFATTLAQGPQRIWEVITVMMLARLKRWEYTAQSPESSQVVIGAYALAEKMIQDLIKEDKANPNISYIMQGARFGGMPLSLNYWASPFIKSVNG